MFCVGCCIQLFGPWSCRERWPFLRSWGRQVRLCVISVYFLHLIGDFIDDETLKHLSQVGGDPTTYVVEHPTKWWRLIWFLCRNLRTISVSHWQDPMIQLAALLVQKRVPTVTGRSLDERLVGTLLKMIVDKGETYTYLTPWLSPFQLLQVIPTYRHSNIFSFRLAHLKRT